MVIPAKSESAAKQGAARRVAVDAYAANSSEQTESEEDDEQSSEEECVRAEHTTDDSMGAEEDEDESDDDIDEVKEQKPSWDRIESQLSASGEQYRIESQLSASGEQCTFDLRNLVAVNSHQLNASSLYSAKKSARESSITIPLEDNRIQVDEEQLLEKARDGCTQLISAIWQLPTEQSDAGPLVTLPSYFEIKIPRALPPPPPKQETKWEKFAKERGIGINHEKRSRKVWDEASGEWMYRHGYQKANNDAAQWPIMEVKRNDDPYADPWEKIRDAKKARVEKNTQNRMKNQEKAGHLPKGDARRVMKNLAASRKAGKAGGNRDRDGVLPAGVPVDLKATKASDKMNSNKRGKESTMLALIASQRSTASLGKFDQMRDGEPERKKSLAGLKKRKFESATDKKAVAMEAEKGMKVFNTVMNGGDVAREKAKRSGSLAKGETAYDYDFDDGLGASTFRKKKGRAGAGKMKKMTKKRAK